MSTVEANAELLEAQEQHAHMLAAWFKKETQLLESQLEILGTLIDISQEEAESNWVRVAGGRQGTLINRLPYDSLQKLSVIRTNSRDLADHNPFAINVIENGKSYIYGTGHNYRVKAREGQEDSVNEKLLTQVREELARFRMEYPEQVDLSPDSPPNSQQSSQFIPSIDKWYLRQLETWERRESEGECFRRLFDANDQLYVRFIEPEQIAPKASEASEFPFGIKFRTNPDNSVDFETPEEFHVRPLTGTPSDADPDAGEWVPAIDIQHLKANVNLNAPRGVPTLYPVDANCRRAARILKNMSTVTEMQAAIAWVVKHLTATNATIEQYVAASAQAKLSSTATGQEKTYRNYNAGSILHSNASTEYQPWATSIDVPKIVAALQAELRTIAARVQYPEFMVSSDASNANYSSTMVAEGPAVKKFERMQFVQISYDLAILYRALSIAARAGRLPANILALIEIEAEPPTVKTRDVMAETQSDIMLAGGQDGKGIRVMSKKDLASRHDLDWDKQRPLIEEELEQEAKLAAKLDPILPAPKPTTTIRNVNDGRTPPKPAGT